MYMQSMQAVIVVYRARPFLAQAYDTSAAIASVEISLPVGIIDRSLVLLDHNCTALSQNVPL